LRQDLPRGVRHVARERREVRHSVPVSVRVDDEGRIEDGPNVGRAGRLRRTLEDAQEVPKEGVGVADVGVGSRSAKDRRGHADFVRLEPTGTVVRARARARARARQDQLLDLVEAGLDAVKDRLNRAEINHGRAPQDGFCFSVVG